MGKRPAIAAADDDDSRTVTKTDYSYQSVRSDIPTVRIFVRQGDRLPKVEVDGAVTVEMVLTCDDGAGSLGSMETQHSQPVRWESVLHEWEQDAHARQLGKDHITRIPRMVRRACTALGVVSIADINRSSMRGYLADLSQSGTKGKPLSPKSMRNYIAGFNAFFEWCKQAEMVPASWANPCEGIRLPRLQENPKRAFTLDEVVRVYEAAKLDETRERPAYTAEDGIVKMRSGIYWLMACTGLRVGIAEKLRVRHLSLGGSSPCIYVPATGTGKERKARTIQISKFDAEILADFLARHPRNPGDDDAPFDRPHPRVFYSDCESGGVKLQDASGRWLGFHSFRRFHATQLLRMKVDPKLVQKRLGHSSLETTTKHYRDIEHDEHAGVARELGDSFSAKMRQLPLTGQGMTADTGNASSLPAIDNSETHAKQCGVDSGPASLHSLPESAAPIGDEPRSGETVSGIQDVEVEDRGLEPLARNERHSRPEDGLLFEAAVTLARILDRLTDDRR